jgi:hypothetical protein
MLRRSLGLLLILFALALVPIAAAAEGAFVGGVEDLPLMPGLMEVEGAATVFDAPQGRIVETFAAGAVTPQAVESFYAQTLPQLGWTASGAREFRREGEKLTLEITPGADATTVRFTLAPQ